MKKREENEDKIILFVETGALFGYSAFTQQFLMEAIGLKESNCRVIVVGLESFKDILRRRSSLYRENLKRASITYLIIPSWFRENLVIDFLFGGINTVILGLIAVLSGAKIIHAHDRRSGSYAVRLRSILGINVIYDIHGINIEERIYGGSLREGCRRHKMLNRIEKRIVDKSDFVFCVSKRMSEFVSSKYNVSMEKFVVTPTCVETGLFSYSEERKNKARERLGLAEKRVILFMGHVNKWQINEAFSVILRELAKRMENAHFLILTDGVEIFKDLLRKCGISDGCYSIYSVKHKDVVDYAISADMAILLRDGSVVNRVAAPAKFGEYLALGVPVMVTEGIGDTGDMIGRYNVGVVLEGLSEEAVVKGIDSILRLIAEDPALPQRCARVASQLLSREACMNTFISVYDRCLDRIS